MKKTAIRFPQVVLLLFLSAMTVAALLCGLPLPRIIDDALVRLAMNGVLVLSMVPMLNGGIGINFGLPVGIMAGLLGMCICVNFELRGFTGFFAALALCLPLGSLSGYVYAGILNRVRGREEIAGTFIGFSIVSLMNFFWAVAPFTNPSMLWPIGGKGMRPSIGLRNYFGQTLTRLFSIEVGGITIPLGLLGFLVLLCIFTALFFRTRAGRAVIAVGENEMFARLSGVDVDLMRTMAVVLSTVIAALGICVYAQCYGFIELYDAPLMMAFPAASAILVGGSTGGRTPVLQVVTGTFLFQTTYLLSGPLANELLLPETAEIFRMLITNGIILYALLHEGGKKKK